jgi:hypothetical protein
LRFIFRVISKTQKITSSKAIFFWGRNPDNKHFSGVDILVKRSKFWAAQVVNWPLDHPCFPFAQDSRLTTVQVWFVRGGIALTIYGIYGMSGARWERSKMNYAHDLLKAIQFDRISRGQIPCILMGDFKLDFARFDPSTTKFITTILV